MGFLGPRVGQFSIGFLEGSLEGSFPGGICRGLESVGPLAEQHQGGSCIADPHF